MNQTTFAQEIERNINQSSVDPSVVTVATQKASLDVRIRGCFATKATLYSSELGRAVDILYSDPDISLPKISASHPMSPVGVSNGIGGQHGFPRWADYDVTELEDGQAGKKQLLFEARRSDGGIGLNKQFGLSDTSLATVTTITNPGGDAERTSLGEHLYFALADERFDGLTVAGKTLDELLGEGAEDTVKNGDFIYWPEFSGSVDIEFPAGHTITLSAKIDGAPEDLLGMLVWHRVGTESICFEPTIGFSVENVGTGLDLEPNKPVGLNTLVELG